MASQESKRVLQGSRGEWEVRFSHHPPLEYRFHGSAADACVGRADLSDDYSDFASSVKALGYLESGITDPLNKFADRMIEFSTVLHHTVRRLLSSQAFLP
jgi:hypothetical protein